MDDRILPAAIVLALLLTLLGLLYLGWMRRRGRQSDVPVPPGVPAEPGDRTLSIAAFYVATTTAGDPLDRIAVGGLGFRARTELVVWETGLELGIPGEDVFIPARSIRSVVRATWTIDRVVESGGLVCVAWVPDDLSDAEPAVLESYFRVTGSDDPETLISAIRSIADRLDNEHRESDDR